MSPPDPARNPAQTLHKAALACLDAMARLSGTFVRPNDPEPEALASLRRAVEMLPAVEQDPFMASNLAELPPEGTSWHDWVGRRARDWAPRLTANLAQPRNQGQAMPPLGYEPEWLKARLLVEMKGLTERPDEEAAGAPKVPACPNCGGPLRQARTGPLCPVCAYPDDTMFDLWAEYIRLETNPDAPLNCPEWPEVRHFTRRLFKHDRFTADTWQCLLDWLQAEHGLSGDALWRTKRSQVVALLRAACETGASGQATSGRPVRKDRKTEARDKWIYEQCCKGVAYDSISRNLSKKNPKWLRIGTKQGIRDCAMRYAKRHGLPEPPPRQER